MYSRAPAWIASTAARVSVPVPQATTGVRIRSASNCCDQFVDRQHDVDHDEIGALAAHHRQRLLDRLRVGHGRAAIHRDPGCYGKLALECADDEKPHGFVLRFSGQP